MLSSEHWEQVGPITTDLGIHGILQLLRSVTKCLARWHSDPDDAGGLLSHQDICRCHRTIPCRAPPGSGESWLDDSKWAPRRQFCAEGVVKTASGCSFTHQIIQNHRIIKVAIAGSQGGAEHACYSNRLEMVISSTLYFVHFIQLFYTCTGPQGLWMQPFPKVQIWDIIDL